MSAAEAVVAIRAALKARGWTQRQVSVRRVPCTYDSKITATIRDASIPLSAVKQIVDAYERVGRDEASGEILAGGNTYVAAEYADGVLDALQTEILAALERGERRVRGFDVREDDRGGFRAWHRDHTRSFNALTLAGVAEELARRTAGEPVEPAVDVEVEREGGLFMFQPRTDAAREWIEEHVADPMWFAGALVVEHGMAADLAAGMSESGLEVR